MLDIAQLGQPVLREVAVEIDEAQIGNPELQAFLAEMLETLREQKGAGLAAPQVFASVRVFLAAITEPAVEGALPDYEVFINPVVTPLAAETKAAWEGCLSFPELLVLVPRFRTVRIEYYNAKGEPRTIDLNDFAARVVQHELDHLDGILTLDRAASTHDIIKASEIDTVLGDDEEEEEDEE
jgi:peptide deformylase